MNDIRGRVREVCHIAVESADEWDPNPTGEAMGAKPGPRVKLYSEYRSYSDSMNGDYWLISKDGQFRSPIYYSIYRLQDAKDYIDTGVKGERR